MIGKGGELRMKKILTIIVCFFFLIFLVGCSFRFNDSKPVIQNREGSLGRYYVKFTDHFVSPSAGGNDILILSFDFTNNGEAGISAASALRLTLYQSGIELSPASRPLSLDGYDSANYQTKVKDGATLNCQAAFRLRSDSDPVEVEIAPSFSFGTEKVTAELDIAG